MKEIEFNSDEKLCIKGTDRLFDGKELGKIKGWSLASSSHTAEYLALENMIKDAEKLGADSYLVNSCKPTRDNNGSEFYVTWNAKAEGVAYKLISEQLNLNFSENKSKKIIPENKSETLEKKVAKIESISFDMGCGSSCSNCDENLNSYLNTRNKDEEMQCPKCNYYLKWGPFFDMGPGGSDY